MYYSMFTLIVLYWISSVLCSGNILTIDDYVNNVIQLIDPMDLNLTIEDESRIFNDLDIFLADKPIYVQLSTQNFINKTGVFLQVNVASFIMKSYYAFTLDKDDSLHQFEILSLFFKERRKEIESICCDMERNPDKPKETFKKNLKDVITKLHGDTSFFKWANLAIINPALYSQYQANDVMESFGNYIHDFIDNCNSLVMLQLFARMLLNHSEELIIYCNKIYEVKENS